jgi:hypothetical protein
VHHLYLDFEIDYDSVGKEVLYNILTGFGVPINLGRPIKKCMSEKYSRVWVGKYLFDLICIRIFENGRSHFTISFQISFRKCHNEDSGTRGQVEIKRYPPAFGIC